MSPVGDRAEKREKNAGSVYDRLWLAAAEIVLCPEVSHFCFILKIGILLFSLSRKINLYVFK